jgi:hypothetical protein
MRVETSKPSSDAGLPGGCAFVLMRHTAPPEPSRGLARVNAGLRPIADFLPGVLIAVMEAPVTRNRPAAAAGCALAGRAMVREW